eukprot:TRINITY_DN5620_c0_g1_i1.p1 TRINITY_DN5620_c0_g1~~TRINITY_DN5620_c0_g1_i1.p1  ORF type:complete len:487 (-),score=72.36 TRINITY_DN5620_c0_g1_i1:86-1546(-)
MPDYYIQSRTPDIEKNENGQGSGRSESMLSRSVFTPIFDDGTGENFVGCNVLVGTKPVCGFLRPLVNGDHITFICETGVPLTYIFSLPPQLECTQEKEPTNAARKVRYRRGHIVGEGAFGKVYQGMNKVTGELLAIKTFDLSAFRSEDVSRQIEQIEAEIDLLSKLDHENVVKYLGCDRKQSQLNILLEFVPGGSISSLIARFGPFSEAVVRLYAAQVLMGLQYLHANNVLHRDIKGANVLVSERGEVKLTDFGLSSAALSDGAKGMVGTLLWMAPETMLNGICVRGSDIWSVGCTIVEMVARRPWPELQFSTDASALYQIASREAPALPEKMSPNAKDFAARCFERNPEDRASCADLLRHPFILEEPVDGKLLREESSQFFHTTPRAHQTMVIPLGHDPFSYDDDEEEAPEHAPDNASESGSEEEAEKNVTHNVLAAFHRSMVGRRIAPKTVHEVGAHLAHLTHSAAFQLLRKREKNAGSKSVGS